MCWAVAQMSPKFKPGTDLMEYPEALKVDIFKPNDPDTAWWGLMWGDDQPDRHERYRVILECRILALLFMQAMDDAGDL